MRQPRGPSNRSFGTLFVVVFTLVGGYAWWRSSATYVGWLGLSGILLLVTVSKPELLAPFNRAWMALANLLHRFVSPIVLGLMFYGVLTPVGIVTRIFGRDVMKRRFDRKMRSYWEERVPPGPEPASLPHQF